VRISAPLYFGYFVLRGINPSYGINIVFRRGCAIPPAEKFLLQRNAESSAAPLPRVRLRVHNA